MNPRRRRAVAIRHVDFLFVLIYSMLQRMGKKILHPLIKVPKIVRLLAVVSCFCMFFFLRIKKGRRPNPTLTPTTIQAKAFFTRARLFRRAFWTNRMCQPPPLPVFLFFYFFILRRMGKSEAKAHYTCTNFRRRRVNRIVFMLYRVCFVKSTAKAADPDGRRECRLR